MIFLKTVSDMGNAALSAAKTTVENAGEALLPFIPAHQRQIAALQTQITSQRTTNLFLLNHNAVLVQEVRSLKKKLIIGVALGLIPTVGAFALGVLTGQEMCK